ncbi:uncharacterized protein LOC131181372 [Hevea brasiliensis]|uniref:uncharacterized protein LOC131181372 n=1 Tax=Hevea brasiliensis TaxID=3981 RepID=UPI0025FD65C9|nr:uncharacterized protein LOC131181372 [Hevea brasiliensis]
MIATLQVKPMLIDQIKVATQSDENYQKLIEEAGDGKKLDLLVNDDGLLLYKGRMCIPNDVKLRQVIMKEAHNSPFDIHPGGTEIYRIVKEHYWWMTQKSQDTIWVIVNRWTKFAHFLPVRMDYSPEKLAKLYIDEIVRLHGVPISIVSDRDPR